MVRSAPRVLIVDDEPDCNEEVREFLEMQGLNCCLAASVDEAEFMIESMTSIRVVVADIRMPTRSGLDLLQAMQGRLPIIVVSGHNTLADRVIAQELGAFRYFPKPLEPFALIDAIRAGLDCQEARDEE